MLLLPMCPGWQCWNAVGMGGAATGGGHAQSETGGGERDGGSAGTLGEAVGIIQLLVHLYTYM